MSNIGVGTTEDHFVTIEKWSHLETFINDRSSNTSMQRKPYIIGIEPGKVKKWLARNTLLAIQNPWYMANELEGAEVLVRGVGQIPVEVVTLRKGGSLCPYLIRPDTVSNMDKAMKLLHTDPEHMGLYFCPEDKVPAEFTKHQLYVFRQAVQYVGDFDSTLNGSQNRHLRQNLARGEKLGLQFERLHYRASEVSDLVIAWTVAKHFDPANLVAQTYGFKNANRIANVALNPFGVVYAVRNKENQLRAIAATLEMGDYVSVECIASHRDVDRAQEFLETRMWQEFARKNIRTVGRGNMDKQSPSLREYKEKFAPLHVREWVCAEPPITREAPLYREF